MRRSAEEHADAIGLSYSAVCRWLRKCREEGMLRLFPATDYPREPQPPEQVIVTLLFYRTCASRASDRESATTDAPVAESVESTRRRPITCHLFSPPLASNDLFDGDSPLSLLFNPAKFPRTLSGL